MDQQNLIELEMKIAFQEVAIEKLQQAFYDQQATIDKLETSVKLLKERLEGVASGGHEIGPGNEKPPHY